METRNQAEFQSKLQAEMEKENIDVLILTQPESVFYATGFMGASHYRFRVCGSSIAIVPSHGKISLIVSEFEHGGAMLQSKGEVNIETYPTWIYIEDFADPTSIEKEVQPNYNRTFEMAAEIVKSQKKLSKIGIETASLTHDKYEYLIATFGREKLRNCADLLIKVKMIKTPWEIDLCRYTAQVAEKMMNKTIATTEVGMTETDIVRNFTSYAYEFTNGGRELIKVNNVHTVGPCYWASLIPREYTLKEGDLVRLDGGVQVYGYLSDLGRTFSVGDKVVPRRQEIFDVLLKGFDTGMAMMGPGIKLSDVFKNMLETIRKNGLPTYIRGHFGHTTGSGATEDYPMIDGKNVIVTEPGMVFCLETPYYSTKNHSYNIEDEFVITENGIERFTYTNRTLKVR